MIPVPPEAVTAARERVEENDAIWRVAAGDTEIAVNARQAILMSALGAAEPHIRAQVLAEIRQLATEKGAMVVEFDPEFPFEPPEIKGPFADWIPAPLDRW